MKVLFTSPILEHPAAGGPQLRIENSIKALSRVCDLHVISRAPAPYAERVRTAEFLRPYCREFSVPPRLERNLDGNPFIRKARRAVRRLLNSDVREDADFVLEHADRHG